MRMIKIDLSETQVSELKKLLRKSGDYRSERALAVIHCHEGMTATAIANILKRRINTICNWLNAYIKHGINGLNRTYSPGRPSKRKARFIPKLEEYLKNTPRDYGFGEILWTVKLLKMQYEKETGESISEDTVKRALHDAGYSAKRPKKTTPSTAPSKKEKLERVCEIIQEIREFSSENEGEVEVVFLDESHFSTDPYVIRGWSKKGVHFFSGNPKKA